MVNWGLPEKSYENAQKRWPEVHWTLQSKVLTKNVCLFLISQPSSQVCLFLVPHTWIQTSLFRFASIIQSLNLMKNSYFSPKDSAQRPPEEKKYDRTMMALGKGDLRCLWWSGMAKRPLCQHLLLLIKISERKKSEKRYKKGIVATSLFADPADAPCGPF